MSASGNSGTYCPRLWDEAFIDERGQVFTCCHCLPEVLGSIYHQTLREICNNETIQRLRRDFLDGRLACYRTWTLRRRVRAALEQSAHRDSINDLRLRILGLV